MFSIIVINTAQNISTSSGWKEHNCQIYTDHRKYVDDEKIIPDKTIRDNFKKYLKEG